jgi:hypothetical protein
MELAYHLVIFWIGVTFEILNIYKWIIGMFGEFLLTYIDVVIIDYPMICCILESIWRFGLRIQQFH